MKNIIIMSSVRSLHLPRHQGRCPAACEDTMGRSYISSYTPSSPPGLPSCRSWSTRFAYAAPLVAPSLHTAQNWRCTTYTATRPSRCLFHTRHIFASGVSVPDWEKRSTRALAPGSPHSLEDLQLHFIYIFVFLFGIHPINILSDFSRTK